MDSNLKAEALKLQWERVSDFLDEVDISRLPKGYLTCAHNTYYALYHAICALNIEYDLPAPSTHKGLLNRFYIDFVDTGVISNKDNKICIKAEFIRAKCDYDGKYKPTIEALIENFENVKSLIAKIKDICEKHQQEQKANLQTTKLYDHLKHVLEKVYPDSDIEIVSVHYSGFEPDNGISRNNPRLISELVFRLSSEIQTWSIVNNELDKRGWHRFPDGDYLNLKTGRMSRLVFFSKKPKTKQDSLTPKR